MSLQDDARHAPKQKLSVSKDELVSALASLVWLGVGMGGRN